MRGRTRVSGAWILIFCICSFVLGMLFTNRWWPQSESNLQILSQRRQEQEAIVPDDCAPKRKVGRAKGIMGEVYETHEAIEALDKTISTIRMELSSSRSSQELSNYDESPVISSSREVRPRRKAFVVIGINTAFSSRKRRDSVRATWVPQGERRFECI